MKRVLHVVTSLEQGGMENGVCNLAIGLQSHGIETSIACLEREGVFSKRLPNHIQITTLAKKNGFTLRTIWRLLRLIHTIRPDLIHTHNLGPLIYSALATFGAKTCPILHGEHSLLADWEKLPSRLRQRRVLYHACRAIHTVSAAQIPEISPLLSSKNKITAIPNGVDTAHFQPREQNYARIQLGLPPGALVLGLVGRFGPFKQHDILMAAFESIAKYNPNLHLLFVGAGGTEEHRVRALAEASAYKNRIHIIGFLNDPAIGYNAMDFLIIPSTNEGMSNAAIEAMSSGVPVIANIDCGHEQIINHGLDGIISDLSTPLQVKASIDSIIASPELIAKIRINARSTVLNRFSLKRMLSDYSKLYEQCISSV